MYLLDTNIISYWMRDDKRVIGRIKKHAPVDLSLSTISSVIILSPLLVLIGILVRLKIGSPVLFKQVRPGLHARPFVIYKFRMMADKRDGDGNLLHARFA